jgi:hypothetical protein
MKNGVPHPWDAVYTNVRKKGMMGVRFRDEQACRYRRRYIVSLAGVSVQTKRTRLEGGLESV